MRLKNEAASSGSSFELELRDLLLRRCRLVFLLGLVISVVFTIALLFLDRIVGLPSGAPTWLPVVRLIHILSFGLALLFLYIFRPSAERLQVIALAVMAANLMLAIFTLAVLRPDQPPFLGVGLGVFITAAFIPWKTRYQTILGATVVLAAVIAQAWTYDALPEVQAIWAARGGERTFRAELIFTTLGNTTFAVVAVLASQTLYSLRKTAHTAKRLGNYLIQRQLGAGGMGQVYVAQHSLIRRPTAVKVMQPSGSDSVSALARFEREVQLSSTLTHPNTITIYDFGRTADNQFYYAMEFLEGLDLQKLVEKFGPLPWERAIYILVQACGALDEAHSRGIIHRDIKPSNIFVTQRGRLYDFVKVLDFGLAKQITDEKAVSITKTGVVFGTPKYISPEVVQGAEVVDGRADLYCLGAVAYWALTGRPPFESGSSVELLIDHMKARPMRPSAVSEQPIPEDLDSIVMRCLEKKPADRFQSAEDLMNALQMVRLADPWGPEKAREWWKLHGLADEMSEAKDLADTEEISIEADISRFFVDPEAQEADRPGGEAGDPSSP